jgi:ribosome-binding factor A
MPKEYPRAARLAPQLQRELTELIRDELTDPRIGQITVTHVDCSPDLRNAKVSVSSFGDDEQLRISVKVLEGAAMRLRRSLGSRLKMRYTPQLRFVADMALREGDRISGLIRAATARDLAQPVQPALIPAGDPGEKSSEEPSPKK